MPEPNDRELKVIDNTPCPATKYKADFWEKKHGDSFVILRFFTSDVYYPEHWTPFSIKCAFKGDEYYKFPNTKYRVADNNFLLLNEGAMYESFIKSEEKVESFSINYSNENLRQMFGALSKKAEKQLDNPFNSIAAPVRFMEKLYSKDNTASRYIHSIRDLSLDMENNYELIKENLFFLLEELLFLQKEISSEIDTIESKKRSTKEELYKRLYQAKDFIDSCYMSDIDLSDIAKASCLDPFYLLRKFKKFFRITPHQYLTQIKIIDAKRMLQNPNTSISEVSKELGFYDLSHFNRVFKRHTALSPESYKKAV